MPGQRVDSSRDCLSVCCIYDGGLVGAVKDLLRGPLERGETVFCIAGPEKSLALQKQLSLASGAFRSNLHFKSPYAEHCVSPARFSEFLGGLCDTAEDISVCIDMSSLPGTLCSVDALADFSFRLYAQKRCNVLAAFDRRLFPPSSLLQVLRFYPFLLINGTLCRNVGGQDIFNVCDPDSESDELLSSCLSAIESGARLAGQCFALPLPPRASGARFKGRVLLVDDNTFSRRVMAGRLKAMGYAVEEAGGGEEAVSFALEKRYSLILMDCHMPQVDGFAASMRIREAEEDYYTPIVALTADDSPSDCRRCILAGMDRLISKGEVSSILGAVLDSLSPVVRISALDMVRDAFDGNVHSLRDYFSSLIKTAGQQASSMRDAVDNGDAASLKLNAHTLRGSSLTVGMRNIGLLCARLEAMSSERKLDGSEKILRRLELEIKSAGSFLDKYLARLESGRQSGMS